MPDIIPQSETLLQRIERLEKAGMEVTRRWFSIWDEAYRYFFSMHDRGIRNKVDWDYIVLNYVWPTAFQEIAKLSKNLQKVIALPWTDDDLEAAEVWQGACQWQLQSSRGLNMRINHPAAIFCGKLRGYRVGRLYWEPKAEWDDKAKKWNGDIRYKLWRPELFWADGEENINDGNCGTVRWVDLEYAQSRWPKFKDQLEKLSQVAGQEQDGSFSGIRFKSWVSSGEMKQSDDSQKAIPDTASELLNLMEGTPKVNSERKMVRLSETFLKNYEEVPKQEFEDVPPEELIAAGLAIQDQMGNLINTATGQQFTPADYPQKPKQWDEPTYPNGQWIITAGSGADRIELNPITIEDPDTQKWQFKSWPFITVPHYLLPFMWQGMNAVTLYKSAQDMINISVTHMVNNLKQFGDPKISVEDGAIMLDPKTKKPVNGGLLSSAAGSIWQWAKGAISKQMFRVEPPVPLSPAATGLYQLFSQEFKNLTGLQGVSRGEAMPAGTTATEAANAVVNSNDRIYLQSIYEDEWFKGLCGLACEMMQYHYDAGRWVRIVGSDKIAGIQQITSREKDVKYDIEVEPGATLPFDEEKGIQKTKMAYDLLAMPTANPLLPEMLRKLNVPNWKKILADLPAWQQYMGIKQLYDQVVAGKMDPNQAAAIIVQEAQKLFNSQNPQGQQPVQGGQGEMPPREVGA